MPQVFKIGSYWVYFWANENGTAGTCACACGTGCANSKRDEDLDHTGG